MRKFLSILMLACLLCGMVLPAGAEGEPTLYVKVGDERDYKTSLSFQAGNTLSAKFYTATTEDSVVISSLTGSTGLTVTGPDTENNFTLTSGTAGTYSVSYVQGETTYNMTVTITPPSSEETNTITVTDVAVLKDALSSQDKFDKFLSDNHYNNTDPLTIVLPAGNLGSITWGEIAPSNKAAVILQGVPETVMTGLTLNGGNVSVDGVTFTGSPAVTANVTCRVSNCRFDTDGDAFQLKQGQRLTLSGNTYYKNASSFALKVPGTGTEMWNVTVPKGATEVDGSVFQVSPVPAEKAMEYNFSSGIMSLLDNKWAIKYTADWPYTKCYVVRDGIAIASVTPTGKSGIPFNVTGQKYYVVEGELPSVTKVDASTKTVKIDETQSKYLGKVSLACDFTAAKVTDGKGNSVYSYLDSDGKLTFNVKKDTADTYTIKEVSTTKTVTKTTTTKTTSRSYNYKYQDYYLITPQRVTDCMRYVKDNLVTIECKEAGRRSISLPVASMAAAAEKGYSILLKNEKIADITIDAAALKSLAQQAKGTTVLLHYRSLNHKTLTTVGQASVQSHLAQYPNDSADLAFLVTATSDSETIEDLQRGAITLKIPFIVLPGTEEDDNVVYALQGENVAEARETTVADGFLTTKLLDLTEHMVFQAGEPVETTEETTEANVETTVEATQPETEAVTETTQPPEPEETDQGFPIWIPIVVAALLAGGGAAAYFLILRKRMKK